MTIRRTMLVLTVLCAATPALACTQNELQAKAVSLGDLVTKISAKDPSRANEWKQKEIAVEQVAATTADLDTICAVYDKAIAEAQASQ